MSSIAWGVVVVVAVAAATLAEIAVWRFVSAMAMFVWVGMLMFSLMLERPRRG